MVCVGTSYTPSLESRHVAIREPAFVGTSAMNSCARVFRSQVSQFTMKEAILSCSLSRPRTQALQLAHRCRRGKALLRDDVLPRSQYEICALSSAVSVPRVQPGQSDEEVACHSTKQAGSSRHVSRSKAERDDAQGIMSEAASLQQVSRAVFPDDPTLVPRLVQHIRKTGCSINLPRPLAPAGMSFRRETLPSDIT